MADFPVFQAQPYNPNQAIQTLSGLMGLKQQQQQLQIGAGEVQQTNRVMAARSFMSQMMQTGVDEQGNSIKSADGSPDPEKVKAAVSRNLPADLAQPVIQNIVKTQSDTANLKDAVRGLSQNYQNDLSGRIRAFVGTGANSKQINEQLDAYADQNPGAAGVVHWAKGLLADHFDNIPTQQQRDLTLTHLAMEMQPSERTAAQQQPSQAYALTKSGAQPVETNPFSPFPQGPQGRGGYQQGIAPGLTSFAGGIAPTGTGTGGMGDQSRGGGGGGPPAAPPSTSNLPAIPRPNINDPVGMQNYADRIKQEGANYQAVSTAATNPVTGVNSQRFRNSQILDLIPAAGGELGPKMGALNLIASRIEALPGYDGKSQSSGADAYQVIEHYAAQNSAAMAQTMGVPNTNLGAQTGAAAAGTVERNPKALRSIVQTNDALNTAMDLYNRGLAKITNNGADMSRSSAYRQAFGQLVNIDAMRLADANRRGDKEEIAQIHKELGAQGVAKAQASLRAVAGLVSTGSLPQ